VGKSDGLALTANEQDCAEQLARFFPQARPVRIPVRVTAARGGRTSLREAAVVEFGGQSTLFFFRPCRWSSTIGCGLRQLGKDNRRRQPSSECSITKDAKRWPSDSCKAPATGCDTAVNKTTTTLNIPAPARSESPRQAQWKKRGRCSRSIWRSRSNCKSKSPSHKQNAACPRNRIWRSLAKRTSGWIQWTSASWYINFVTSSR